MNSPNRDPSNNNLGAGEDLRLREIFREAEPPYLDDAGFTALVVGRLPPSRAWRARRRRMLVGSAAGLGAVVAVVCSGTELVAAATVGWNLLCEWSVLPVPAAGPALPLGSLMVFVATVAVGWWSYARER